MIAVKICSEPADRIRIKLQFESIQPGIPQMPAEAGSVLQNDIAHSKTAANEGWWVGIVKNE
jgi:hypothetical protein